MTAAQRLRGLPTPMAGLALGVASLGWCLENALPLHGWGQIAGAAVASLLLALLVLRFALHFDTLKADLKHPVAGSIVPTFAMALMVISRAALDALPRFAVGLRLVAAARPRDGEDGALVVRAARGVDRRRRVVSRRPGAPPAL